MDSNANSFSINAHTFVISDKNSIESKSLLASDITYHIPIFQRPYSWTEKEITKFVTDIFISFWGIDGESEPEPIFIGTMQLSEIKSRPNLKNFYDVIDGQQRLTTILIVLKYLSLAYPGSLNAKKLNLNWLVTSVSNGAQQDELSSMLNAEDVKSEQEITNSFLRNLNIASTVIDELINRGDDRSSDFKIERFIDHLCTKLYFVVIQTKASLTKTLQIFNAINTTGLDLNGSDIFKLRMFEYLKDRNQGCNENDLFKEISSLYEKIEIYNRQCSANIFSFADVLNIYRYVLVQRFQLPKVLYEMGVDLFYENLFDAISRAARPEHFRNLNGIMLSCAELDRIIDAMIFWNEARYPIAEDACTVLFIERSRYSKFGVFIYLFLYHYDCNETSLNLLFPFLRLINRIYWIFSIIFLRKVYHLDSWSYDCLDHLMDKSYDELMNFIYLKINGTDQYDRNLKDEVIRTLSGNIVGNYKTKTLICRLSALLDEDYRSSSQDKEKEIVKRLFTDIFDVEHIQSAEDKIVAERENIRAAWGADLNAIGNLVAMESSINRAMHNNKYADKRNAYCNSSFPSIAKLLIEYPEWGLNFAKDRKKKEIDKITAYIFN